MTFPSDDDTTEAHERRIVRCREQSCRAQIIFLETDAGRKIPVDADTVKPEDTIFDADEGHVAHFSTCKKPEQFRKPRS